jgi:hypothetical protein
MTNQSTAKIVVGSLIGAALIHLALVACSSDSSSSGATYGAQDPTKDAHANTGGSTGSPSGTAPTPCKQWEIIASRSHTVFPKGSQVADADGDMVQAYVLPEGWEPYGGDDFVAMRRCVK